MIWLGGAPGSGKSTIAWMLSRQLDLPLHPVDLWTYDHRERLPQRPRHSTTNSPKARSTPPPRSSPLRTLGCRS